MTNPTIFFTLNLTNGFRTWATAASASVLPTMHRKNLATLFFVNLPQEGDEVEVGSAFGDVESVKAVSDVYSPVSGVVCAINEELLDHPENINQDAYAAWMIQVNEVSDKEELLSAEEYEKFLSEEE